MQLKSSQDGTMIAAHYAVLAAVSSADDVLTSSIENAISPSGDSLSVVLLVVDAYFIGGWEMYFAFLKFD